MKRNKGRELVNLSLTIPKEEYEWLRRLCFEKRVSMSHFVAKLLEEIMREFTTEPNNAEM